MFVEDVAALIKSRLDTNDAMNDGRSGTLSFEDCDVLATEVCKLVRETIDGVAADFLSRGML